MNFTGNVEKQLYNILFATMTKNSLSAVKRMMEIRDDINVHYNHFPIKVDVHDQYFNMAEKIEPLKHIIDIPKRVFEALDIVPNTEPIRGGTDGSQLSGYLHLIFYWLCKFPRSF